MTDEGPSDPQVQSDSSGMEDGSSEMRREETKMRHRHEHTDPWKK